MASLNRNSMFVFLTTPLVASFGINVIVGGVVSSTPILRTVKVAVEALMALSASSSTDSMAT